MADRKLTNASIATLTSLADGDLIHAVDISDTTSDPAGTSKKITHANLLSGLTTANIAASTDKNYVTDAEATVIGNTSGTNTGDQTNITGNAATVTTNANLTGDVTSVGNATTLTNAPVIAKVLTGYSKGAGTVAATDSILAAMQKLDANDDAKADKGEILSETTTARTLALTDAGDYIRCNNASAQVITVPLNATVAFLIETQIDFIQIGAGQVSFVATGGVTINKAEGLKISAQYKAAALKKVATDEWDLIGALEA